MLTLFLALLAAPQTQDAARVAAWRQDLEQIVHDIRALHPDPFRKTGALTFARQARALASALPELTEEQRVVRAMELVASLGDGHTQLVPNRPDFGRWYPVRLYEFADGVFVTSAHASVAELAGAQVVRIAGRPVAEVLARAKALLGADNAFGSMERIYAVHSASLMKGLGYAGPDGALEVTFRLHDGAEAQRTLVPSRADGKRFAPDDSSFEWTYSREMFGPPFGSEDEWIDAYEQVPANTYRALHAERPLHLARCAPYVARSLPEHESYYAQLNQVDDSLLLPFVRKVLTEVEREKPRRLILDLRFDFGGDGSRVNEMVDEFVARERSGCWRELYVLTGRKTFSAGIMALDALLDHLTCTVVGEPSGAPRNHFGDATERDYAGTGLRLYVSTLWHQLGGSEELDEFVPVDVPAPFTFADLVAGRDPAVDPILEGAEMRSIPIIARTDGGAAARKVYLERKARCARFAWLTPPREIDLRMIAKDQEPRTALETCQLCVEIHPDVWNAWYNLGNVQWRLGLQQDARESYRKVLEVDPHNFNAAELRALLAQPAPAR